MAYSNHNTVCVCVCVSCHKKMVCMCVWLVFRKTVSVYEVQCMKVTTRCV